MCRVVLEYFIYFLLKLFKNRKINSFYLVISNICIIFAVEEIIFIIKFKVRTILWKRKVFMF